MPLGLLETRRINEAMREVGAVSPATACRARDLPAVVREGLERYVSAGVVREGAPGTYYLFEVKAPPLTGRRILMAVLFWLLVIIIPVAILQLSNARNPSAP